MKTISLENLQLAAKINPQIWHDALHSGKIIDGVNLELPDEFLIEIPATPPTIKRLPISLPNLILAVPIDQWPLWARWLAQRRQPADSGTGDTLERHLKGIAADKAAHLYERLTGNHCGCTDRKAWLNQKYNYLNLKT